MVVPQLEMVFDPSQNDLPSEAVIEECADDREGVQHLWSEQVPSNRKFSSAVLVKETCLKVACTCSRTGKSRRPVPSEKESGLHQSVSMERLKSSGSECSRTNR